MIANELHAVISDLVEQATGVPFHPTAFQVCHGGCIHRCGIHADGDRRFFVKVNDISCLPMFEAEALGLHAMEATHTIRVPKVIGHSTAGDQALLVLEAIAFDRGEADAWQEMGRQLASMHRCEGESYGWIGDNFIGSNRQSNARCDSWARFFVEYRLRFQFQIAQDHGLNFGGWEAFLEVAASLLDGHQPARSLLHGDLWSGNVGFSAEGDPLVFDPACYHGDRECDLAFSECFDGFPDEFYRAYCKAWPVDEGYALRRDLYNLYHVINHANLFGGGYVGQATRMMRSLAS